MTAADHSQVADLHAQARAQWSDLVSRLADPPLVAAVDAAGEAILAALGSGHQLLVAGNGGSAAMASHVAAEFAGKCVMDRRPLPALSLAESSTTVTAVANDYGFEQVFVRGVRAFGRPGDVLHRHVDQRHLPERGRCPGGGPRPRPHDHPPDR